MATTAAPWSLPYPVGTDRVMDGDDVIHALADRVQAVLTGTDSALAWGAWTPTFISGGTIGNATRAGLFTQLGKTVYFTGSIQLGSTSSISGQIVVSIPVAAHASLSFAILAIDLNDAGAATYVGYPALTSTTGITAYTLPTNGAYLTSNVTGSNFPFIWGTTDSIVYRGVYQAA